MAKPKPIQLSKELYNELLQAERVYSASFAEFDKAESCDIDCTELRAHAAEMLDLIKRLKENYSPSR